MADQYYDGACTGQQIDETVQQGIVVVSCGTITALPFTVSNANILASHVVVSSRFSAPSAQQGTWTVTTENGSLTISGTIARNTTLELILARRSQSV